MKRRHRNKPEPGDGVPFTGPTADELRGKRDVAAAVSRAISFRTADMAGDFDLLSELRLHGATYAASEGNKPVWVSMYRTPNYALMSLARVLAGDPTTRSHSSDEAAVSACALYGALRLYGSKTFQEWEELRRCALRADYRDDEDADDVHQLLRTFRLDVRDLSHGSQEKKVRTPDAIHAQIAGAAKVLGIAGNTLHLVCFLDGLREQRERDVLRRHAAAMTETVQELYRLIERRTRKLSNMIAAVGIKS